ncbi:transactivator protein [Jacquemontia mosaic Yucatan virus]|uniref:Transcriptional activator protein n=1 Tax=Jacquemontia mosaic Yucatan virus TaxID=1198450 RepID=I6QMX5_9GEMI|nr:transactivator protein [Jacquemontia mosaic Yucatan virus]AFM38718.1 transactivator protein [Jacquemontia mosaic Yucatan virus]
MQPSSSSTPPSIKPKHRIAKSRAIRRKRIDLDCGCSIYVHINCANHGFTHRGTHHCSSSREWRFYLGGTNSPLFQDLPRGGSTIQSDEDLPRSDPVQQQPEEASGSTQGLRELPGLDDIPDSFWDDLFSVV